MENQKYSLSKHKNSLLMNITKIESKQTAKIDIFLFCFNIVLKVWKNEHINHTKHMSNQISFILSKLPPW